MDGFMIRAAILAFATVLVLVLVAAAVLYVELGRDEVKADIAKLEKQWHKPPPPMPEDQITYYTLPEMRALINPRGPGRQLVLYAAALRLHSQSDQVYVQNSMPVIIDAFQCYFRDDDIGSPTQLVDIAKLKRVMTQRINVILAPGRIDDVLFRELAVQ